MATDKQLVANRQNALKSSGPRSLDGKRRSSQNALRHGLTATQTVIPGEDQAEFAEFRLSLFNSENPQGVLENQLVERIANLLWRLRRVQAFEVALMQWMAHYQRARYDDPIMVEEVSQRNDQNGDQPSPDFRDSLVVGRMFEALLSENLAAKLTRYETGMQRQLGMTLKELLELKKARQERAQPYESKKRGVRDSNVELAGEMDADYWAEQDRQRILRADPP